MREKYKKDYKKAVLLALFPGLGFLYLEKIPYFLLFSVITFLPLMGIKAMGSMVLVGSLGLYAISIYYCYVLAKETQRNKNEYKKDPYLIMCLSLLLDGLGQFVLGQKKKAMIMIPTGLTSCIAVWTVFIFKYGFIELFLAPKESPLFIITNALFTWFFVSLGVKFLSMVDAFYSTYHLYIAKKK